MGEAVSRGELSKGRTPRMAGANQVPKYPLTDREGALTPLRSKGEPINSRIVTVVGSSGVITPAQMLNDILFDGSTPPVVTAPSAADIFVPLGSLYLTEIHTTWHQLYDNPTSLPITVNFGPGFLYPTSLLVPPFSNVQDVIWEVFGKNPPQIQQIYQGQINYLTPGTFGLAEVTVNSNGQITNVIEGHIRPGFGLDSIPNPMTTRFSDIFKVTPHALAFINNALNLPSMGPISWTGNGNSNTPDITIPSTGTQITINTPGRYCWRIAITTRPLNPNNFVIWDVTFNMPFSHSFGTVVSPTVTPDYHEAVLLYNVEITATPKTFEIRNNDLAPTTLDGIPGVVPVTLGGDLYIERIR